MESAGHRLHCGRPIQTRFAHYFPAPGRPRYSGDHRSVHEVTTRHFIIATAGHVDHGKSALVKALTGTDPDRLPEEKARGITIDLGFANVRLPVPPSTLNKRQSGSDQPSTFSVGIVDVPGHEDFVRNMIAGVG